MSTVEKIKKAYLRYMGLLLSEIGSNVSDEYPKEELLVAVSFGVGNTNPANNFKETIDFIESSKDEIIATMDVVIDEDEDATDVEKTTLKHNVKTDIMKAVDCVLNCRVPVVTESEEVTPAVSD